MTPLSLQTAISVKLLTSPHRNATAQRKEYALESILQRRKLPLIVLSQ